VFSSHYQDTLLQRIGLSILSITCTTRAWERIVSDVPDPPIVLLLSQVGLSAYAIGTAVKLCRVVHIWRHKGMA
jgi:hypothetical protein